MSGLADKVMSLILDGAQPAPAGTFREMADRLRAQAGSLNAAARIAGVDRRTYQRWYERWNAGKEPKPKAGTGGKLAAGLRAASVAKTMPAAGAVELRVVDRSQGKDRRHEGRTRVITGRQLKLSDGALQAAADAYVRTGDPESAAAAFLAGVGDPFYRRWLAPPSSNRPAPGAAGGGGGGGAGGGGGGGGGGSSGGGGGGGDDEDQDDDEDEFEDLDAWDEFYDDLYDGDIPDEGYGGDVTG